jgi:nitroreductase
MEQINSLQEKLHHEIRDEVKDYRVAEHPIDPIFLNRWSPRAFSPKPIDDEVLWSVLEAARWAPSASNEQPWRFIIARSEADRAKFLQFLNPGNQRWAKDAPVLLVIVSKQSFTPTGTLNPVHQFDAGTASGFMHLQAAQNGLYVHGMAGFDNDQARAILGVPEEFDILAVFAIGKRGDIAQLPADLQAREVPSDRRPLAQTVMEGEFRAL